MTAARSSLFLSRTESTPSFRWLSAVRSQSSRPGTHSTDGWMTGPTIEHVEGSRRRGARREARPRRRQQPTPNCAPSAPSKHWPGGGRSPTPTIVADAAATPTCGRNLPPRRQTPASRRRRQRCPMDRAFAGRVGKPPTRAHPRVIFSRQTTRGGPAVLPPRPHRRRRDATRPDPISPAIYASIDPVPPWPWPLPLPVPVEAQGARARNYWLPRIVLATDRGGEELSGLGRSVSSAIKPRLAGMAVCVRVRRRPDDHWIGRHCVRVAARGSCQAMERGGVE